MVVADNKAVELETCHLTEACRAERKECETQIQSGYAGHCHGARFEPPIKRYSALESEKIEQRLEPATCGQ